MRLNVLSYKAPVLEAKIPVPEVKMPLYAKCKKAEGDSAKIDDAAVVKCRKGQCGTGNKKEYLSPDIDGNGRVGLEDLSLLLARWAQQDAKCDLDQDGKVNDNDLKFLLKHYGQDIK